MTVLKVVDELDQPLALLFNYACHPVVLGSDNRWVSADFPGVACSALERVYGGDFVALFLQGCCGDLNPVRRGNFEIAEWAGRIVAAEVLRAAEKVPGASPWASLKALAKKVDLPLAPLPPREEVEALLESGVEWIRDWAKEALQVLERGKPQKGSVKAELQAFRLTEEVALVALPGEIFCALGLAIKRDSPFSHTMTVGYANGCVGYIPTREAFEEGGYEPAQAFCLYGLQPFDPSVGERLTEEAVKLLRELGD